MYVLRQVLLTEFNGMAGLTFCVTRYLPLLITRQSKIACKLNNTVFHAYTELDKMGA
jgi:hypothetical protein